MYATRQDIIDRYGLNALIVAADRDGDGAEDAGVVDKALADATDEMNSYIGAKYELPLAEPLPVLTGKCVDIAFYKLCQGTASLSEEISKRNDQATSWLRDVSRGLVSLGREQAPPPAGGVKFESAERRFTRDSLKGM